MFSEGNKVVPTPPPTTMPPKNSQRHSTTFLQPGEADAADAGSSPDGVMKPHRRCADHQCPGQGRQMDAGDLPGEPLRYRIALGQHGVSFAKQWWSSAYGRVRVRSIAPTS
jgi:hypothetical protein